MTEQTGPKRPIDTSTEVLPSFADLGISNFLLTVLDKLGLSIPTPIQRKAIPIAVTGQDLIGIAQTGTGKTYAFGLPMIERLNNTSGQVFHSKNIMYFFNFHNNPSIYVFC